MTIYMPQTLRLIFASQSKEAVDEILCKCLHKVNENKGIEYFVVVDHE